MFEFGMIKVIEGGSWDFHEPACTFVKMSSRGLIGQDRSVLEKRASAALLSQLAQIKTAADEPLIHLLAIGATEDYGCFFAGAPVQTANGLRPIEQLREGDSVLTHKNRYRPVRSLFRREYTGEKITLKIACLPMPLIATANHPVWIVRAADFDIHRRAHCFLKLKGKTKLQATAEAVERAQFVRADQVCRGDFVIVPTRPECPNAKALPDDLAYALGLYIAEGCIGRDYRKDRKTKGEISRAVFSMSKESDQRPVARLRRIMHERGHEIMLSDSQSSEKGLRIEVCWPGFAQLASQLFGSTALTKHIPPEVFAQSAGWLRDFLAGYFDGDGCLNTERDVPRYENALRANSASLNLILDLQRLLSRLELPSSGCFGENKKANGCFGTADRDLPCYELYVGSAYSQAIVQDCERLASVQLLPRQKQAHAQTSGDYLLLPVRRILTESVADTTVFNIEAEEDHSYVTCCAVGNSNRNGDGFKRTTCKQYHPTFVKHARWFRDHQNKNTAKSYGLVKLSDYNEAMKRIELVVALNGSEAAAKRNGGLLADRELEKLASGKDLAVSMACRVSHDCCSWCGNKAASRDEYCDSPENGGLCKAGGLKHHIGEVVEMEKDGQPVLHHLHADNPHPTFFDISDVFRPADRIAYVTGMLKAAGMEKVSGVQLAEMLGVTVPYALLVDQQFPGDTQRLFKLAYQLSDMEQQSVESRQFDRYLPALRVNAQRSAGAAPPHFQEKFAAALRALADARVCWPLATFIEATAGYPMEKAAATAEIVGLHLPGIYSRLLGRPDFTERITRNPYVPAAAAGPAMRIWAEKQAADLSLAERYLRPRLTLAAIRGTATVRQGEMEKVASERDAAERLAEEFALYKLAFLSTIPETDPEMPLTASLVLMQN